LFVVLLADVRRRGGAVEVATIARMSLPTIRQEMLEIQRAVSESCDWVRKTGGGRKRIEEERLG
jgi:hypothetical protein